MKRVLSVLRMELLLLRRGAPLPLMAYALLIPLFRERDIGHVIVRDGLLAPVLLGSTGITFAVVIGHMVIHPAPWTLPLRTGYILAVRLAFWALAGAAVLVPLLARPERYGWTGVAAAVSTAFSGVAAGALYVAITPSSGWRRPETTVFTLLPILIAQGAFWIKAVTEGSADSWEAAAFTVAVALCLGGVALYRDASRECAPPGTAPARGPRKAGPMPEGRGTRRVLLAAVWGGGAGWAAVLVCGLAIWGLLIRTNGGLGVGPLWEMVMGSWWIIAFMAFSFADPFIHQGHRGEAFLDSLPISRRTVFLLRTGPMVALFLASAAVIIADAGNLRYPSLVVADRDALTYTRGDHIHRLPVPFAESRTPEDLAGRVEAWLEERHGATVDRNAVVDAAPPAWVRHPQRPAGLSRPAGIGASRGGLDPVVLPSLRRAARERALLVWILILGTASVLYRLSLRSRPGSNSGGFPLKAVVGVIAIACLAVWVSKGDLANDFAAGMTAVWLAVARWFQALWPVWTAAWAAGMVLLWRSSERAWLRFDAEDRGLLNRTTAEVV